MSETKAVVRVYSRHMRQVAKTVGNPSGMEAGEPKQYCVELKGPLVFWSFLANVDDHERIYRVGTKDYCEMIATKLNKAALHPHNHPYDPDIL